MERRLDAIHGDVVGTAVGKGLGWRDLTVTPTLAMAWLGLSSDASTVRLCMYPGDTLGQSREFYGNPSVVQAVLELKRDGWQVEPNFHWGFMTGGYAGSKTPLSVEKYCAYWIAEIGGTRELSRSEWDAYWNKLERNHIVEASGKEAFDGQFTRSQRPRAHPRPGLVCEYTWPIADARRLDSRGKFVETVRVRLNQMLTVLGAQPVTGRAAPP